MTELNYAQLEEAILGGTTQRRGETVMVRGKVPGSLIRRASATSI